MLMKCDFAGGDERIFEGPRVVIYLLEGPSFMIHLPSRGPAS
jgi:hypothetical protein